MCGPYIIKEESVGIMLGNTSVHKSSRQRIIAWGVLFYAVRAVSNETDGYFHYELVVQFLILLICLKLLNHTVTVFQSIRYSSLYWTVRSCSECACSSTHPRHYMSLDVGVTTRTAFPGNRITDAHPVASHFIDWAIILSLTFGEYRFFILKDYTPTALNSTSTV